jgi:hypothetical protein
METGGGTRAAGMEATDDHDLVQLALLAGTVLENSTTIPRLQDKHSTLEREIFSEFEHIMADGNRKKERLMSDGRDAQKVTHLVISSAQASGDIEAIHPTISLPTLVGKNDKSIRHLHNTIMEMSSDLADPAVIEFMGQDEEQLLKILSEPQPLLARTFRTMSTVLITLHSYSKSFRNADHGYSIPVIFDSIKLWRLVMRLLVSLTCTTNRPLSSFVSYTEYYTTS